MSAVSETQSLTLSVPEGAKTIHDTLDEGRYHVVLGLSPEFNKDVEDLALHYRISKGDVFNVAVGLLKFFSKAAQEGKRVGVAADDQELETEITGL